MCRELIGTLLWLYKNEVMVAWTKLLYGEMGRWGEVGEFEKY
jgi:hypothetical protein